MKWAPFWITENVTVGLLVGCEEEFQQMIGEVPFPHFCFRCLFQFVCKSQKCSTWTKFNILILFCQFYFFFFNCEPLCTTRRKTHRWKLFCPYFKIGSHCAYVRRSLWNNTKFKSFVFIWQFILFYIIYVVKYSQANAIWQMTTYYMNCKRLIIIILVSQH